MDKEEDQELQKNDLNLYLEHHFTNEQFISFQNMSKQKEAIEFCFILLKSGLRYEYLSVLMNKSDYFEKLEKRQQQKIMVTAQRKFERESKSKEEPFYNAVDYYISTKQKSKDELIHNYYTNDTDMARVYHRIDTERKYEDNQGKEQTFTSSARGDPILNVAFTGVKVYRNQYTETDVFEIQFITKNRRKITYKGLISDIIGKLRLNAHVANKYKAEDALSCLISEVETSGNIQVEKTLNVEGFFFSGDELLGPKEYQNLDLFKLKDALETFDKAINEFYGQLKDKAMKIAKWMLIAPFAFAKKQLYERREPVKLLHHLLTRGPGGCGKTKAHQLFSMFYLDARYPISADSISTVPRLARQVSRTTFPIIANEPISIFSGKGRNQDVRETLKNLFENIVVRSKYSSSMTFVTEFGASALSFTSNYQIKFRDTGESRRFHRNSFTTKDKNYILTNQDNFDNFMAIEAHKLEEIGTACYTILKEQPLLLITDYETLAEDLFSELYTMVDMETPDWIKTRPQIVDHGSSVKEDVLQALKDYANDMITHNRIPIFDDQGDVVLASFTSRIDYLTENNLKTNVYLVHKKDKQGIIQSSNFYIMNDFLEYLSNKEIGVSSSEDLADILGGKYDKYTRSKIFGTQWAVKISNSKLDI